MEGCLIYRCRSCKKHERIEVSDISIALERALGNKAYGKGSHPYLDPPLLKIHQCSTKSRRVGVADLIGADADPAVQ